ncbi:MAG TPA: Uma2 family endonuclease, partial [Planctomycetaceae bacterium]|nr:Uma2 family endonuclease [Planctomycetaceae bacterium]
MPTLIQDADLARQLIARRQRMGHDRSDEVWDGTYVIYSPPDNEHQEIRAQLTSLLVGIIDYQHIGKVRPGVNLSDRDRGWRKNYRCPDVVVFLNNTKGVDCDTHWVGGADFAVEIISPGDRSREKLDFYATVGTRELLLVDRKPWSLELFRLDGEKLVRVGKSTLAKREWLTSEVVPLKWRIVA